ncbi:MAG: acyl-CoA thioesterase II [Bacteroidota bacterium]
MENVQELLPYIELESIEENIFRGKSHPFVGKRVFGGQVLAQALAAATLTVPEERVVHSLHGYFILPGDTSLPIVYSVDRVRDGGSFTTRRVKAIQKGQDIFVLAASYQLKQEGFDHQIEMPDVPSPDELLNDQELLEKFKDHLPENLSWGARPIEFKPVEIPKMFIPVAGEPFQNVWVRAKGTLGDDPRLHQQILAYASDYNLLSTALGPHPITIDKLQMASLDHAMWFHREFRADDWLLYHIDSPSASNARGFTRGSLFDQQGKLVASVVQEGLVRKRRKK